MPGESLVMKAHQHWVVLVRPLLLPLLLIVVAVVYDLIPNWTPPLPQSVVTLVLLALAVLWMVVVYIRWRSRGFTVTDRRVLLDTGVFSRSSKVIALDRVQDITTNQSLLGRMLGYGRIEIDSAGAAGAEILTDIPHPNKFRDEVFVRAESLRSAGPGGTPPAAV